MSKSVFRKVFPTENPFLKCTSLDEIKLVSLYLAGLFKALFNQKGLSRQELESCLCRLRDFEIIAVDRLSDLINIEVDNVSK